MTDKKDPIQLAAEEYQRALEESISKKKEELIEEKKAQAAAEQEAQELTEAEQKLQEIQAKRAIIRRLRELKEAEERGEDIQEISESVEEESQEEELVEVRTAMDNYVDAIKSHEKKKVQEDANLLGGGEGGEVSRAEFQALKTSLASLGGGGLGERDVIDLIAIHAPGGSGGTDSGGLDSQQILDLLGLNQGDTIVINQGDSINNLWQIINVDSNSQIITIGGDSTTNIWNILNIDSSDTLLTLSNLDSYQYTDSDVIDLLNDSGVQNILPQLDSTYDLGDSARRWKDLWLSGNTIHLGDVDISSVGDSGVGVYANGRRLAYLYETDSGATGGLDSAAVIRLIDSALDSTGASGYTTADHDSDTLAQVDSAYVQARVTFPVDSVGLDSAAVAALIDSALDSLGAHYTTADHDSDTLVQVDSAYVRARVKTDQDLSTTDIVTFDQVFANLDGAIEFKANNRSGGVLLKGQPVYIDGIDGNKPTVALADANDPNKMPAYGLIFEDANDNADAIVVTFGTLKDVDTSAYNLGDTLYIGTTPGELVTTPPAGTNSLIQNIGRVIRSHGTAGSIKVGGAGRSNATPNLSAGQIFYGNDSDRAVPVLATDVFDSAYINSLVDDPYLHELQDVQIDSTTLDADEFLQWNGSVWTHRPLTIETSLQFKGSIDVTTDSAPTGVSGALYVNTGTGVALGSYTGVAGDSFQSGQTIAWSDSDARWYQMGVSTSGSILEVRAGSGIAVDDSDAERPLVSINRTTTDQWYLDSAEAIVLIDDRIPIIVDSAYVQLRQDHYTRPEFESDALSFIDSGYINARSNHYTTADHDSDTLVQVDSAYVQARVTFPVDSTGIDSVQAVAIIDSYVDSAFVIRHADSHFVNAAGDSMTGDLFLPSVHADSAVYIAGGILTADSLQEAADPASIYWMPLADTNFNNEGIMAIAGDGSTLVAVTYQGSIGVSKDGETFSVDKVSTSIFSDVISMGSSTWLAVGSAGVYKSTDDAVTFTRISGLGLSTNQRTSVAYDGSSVLVAVGRFGQVTRSTNGGTTWTTQTTPWNINQYDDFTGVLWDGAQFVAVGNQVTAPTQTIMTSPDGITWTLRTAANSNGFNEIGYDGAGTLVAVGKQGNIEYSTDSGVTWTLATGQQSAHYNAVHYAAGLWMAISDDYNGRVAVSTDGINWQVISDTGHQTNGVTYLDGKWYAAGKNGSIATAEWTAGGAPQTLYWNKSPVATRDNLILALKAIQELQNNTGTFVFDSDPSVAATYGDSDSSQGSQFVEDGRFWYNPDTSTLSIRDSGTWVTIGGGSTLNNTDSLPEGDSNLYYTTARHDSDTLVQVDSAYVQARQLLGGSVTVDSVAPSPASNGQLWYDPTSSVLHIRDSGAWDSINAQDSGAYLLLSGGTVTGPLNLDSGGIQLGPEGGSRTKLYTGIASFESSWSTQSADPGFTIVSSQGFQHSARNPSTGRIVAKANVSPLDMAYSDDDGATWTRVPTAQIPYNTTSGGLFDLSWDSTSGKFWAVLSNPKDSAGDLATVIQYSNDGIDWKSVDYGTDTWITRFSSGNNRSDELVLRGQTTHTVGQDWISWGYDDSNNIIGFAGDASEYVGGNSDDNSTGVQGEGLVRTVPGTVTDSSGGTWIVFGRTNQGGGGKINGGNHFIFPKHYTGKGRTKVGGPMVYSKRHQEWIKVWGNGRDNFQPDSRYGLDGDGSMDWKVFKSPDGGKTWTNYGSPGYDYNDIQQVGDERGYFNFNGVTVFQYNEETDVLFMSGRFTGSIYTADWGETWNRIGFSSLTDTNQRSTVDGQYGFFTRENLVYNKDEGYYYVTGKVGGNATERGFVSYDLKNWRTVPEDLSPSGTDGSVNVVEWIGGNNYWRAGVGTEPNVALTGEIGTFGEVERDLGVLKFGKETVLTDSNMIDFVNASYIEERLPTQYAMSGVSSLVIEPVADVSQVGTVRKRTGKLANATLAKQFNPPSFSAPSGEFAEGIYEITFNTADVTDSNYAVVATIESQTDWTASARTVTIYQKSDTGFKLLVERTDTGANKEIDAKSISVIIHE